MIQQLAAGFGGGLPGNLWDCRLGAAAFTCTESIILDAFGLLEMRPER
jgi:hypothetical protein